MTVDSLPTTGLMARDPETDEPIAAEQVPLTGVRIDIAARGTASAVTVSQRYVNRERVPVEAVYTFPLEDGAAVHGFEALIGDRRVISRVERRDDAFEAYDAAMAEGHGAFLLDQDRPNLFTASLGNLLPGQQAVLTLRYVAPLERNGDQIRLKVPTTAAPRYIPAEQLRRMDPAEFDHLNPPAVAGGVPYGLALDVRFEGASDVLSVECPSHPARVSVSGRTAAVSLSGSDLQLDRDVVVTFTVAGAGGSELQAVRDDRGDLVMMLDVTPPAGEERSPVEAVFLIDRSGSMGGSSIEQARNALLLALSSLREGDRFNVLGFGSTVESVLPAPLAYDDSSLERARQAVRGWQANLGGTELMGPLAHILGGPAGDLPRRVMVLTDGQVGNEEECIALVHSHAAAASVFAIGVGHGASDSLVRGIARAGNGVAEFVHPNERIESAVMRQAARMTSTGLGDLRIDWAGLPVDLVAPATLPPLYPGTRLTAFARVPASRLAANLGRLSVVAEASGPAGVERFTATADLAGTTADSAIPVLLAREAIRDLEEGRAAGARGSRQRARTEGATADCVAELALRYGLMSSETSFVAIEERESADGEVPASELRRVPVALLHDWHGTAAVGTRMLTMSLANAMPAPVPMLHRALAQRAPAGFYPEVAAMQSLALAEPSPMRSDLRADTDADAQQQDALVGLAAAQRADGSWRWEDGMAEILGRTPKEVGSLLGGLGLDPAAVGLAGATLLALGTLVRDFADREADWRAMADKALRWLGAHGVRSPESGVPLERWVAARL